MWKRPPRECKELWRSWRYTCIGSHYQTSWTSVPIRECSTSQRAAGLRVRPRSFYAALTCHRISRSERRFTGTSSCRVSRVSRQPGDSGNRHHRLRDLLRQCFRCRELGSEEAEEEALAELLASRPVLLLGVFGGSHTGSTARAGKADLIVLGTHGVHRGMNHLVLGSNTERILLSSCVPTLTVGRHVMGGVDLDLQFRELLYISDFSPEAAAAASFALVLSQDFAAPIGVCQLMPSSAEHDPSLRESLVRQYTERLKGVLPDGEHRWSSGAFHLKRRVTKDQVVRGRNPTVRV